ncbi:MAG: outer membrane lipoprotein carrier protein LolA [Bacteroidales bacterium]|nr:outer membrane lipoprotein carrier protein LolA [Bacteroidales bacterium]
MKRNGFVLVVLLLAVWGAVCAQTPRELTGKDRTAAVAELETKTKAIKSFTGQFKQTRETTMLKESVESSGRISFKRDGAIKWEYLKPQAKVIEIKGETLSVDGVSSGRGNRMAKGIAGMVSDMLQQGKVADERVFDFKLYDDGKNYNLKAKPKRRDMQRMMSAVDITFDKGDGSMRKMILTEKDGNRTTIEFVGLKIGN